MMLSPINHAFLTAICGILGIRTKISFSTDYGSLEGRTERLVDLCMKSGATEYLSGPAARDYLDGEQFRKAGIKVSWMDYSGYPGYRQLYPPFEHSVSIIDLLFNEGPDALRFMKSSTTAS